MPAKRLPRIDYQWTPKLAYCVGLITTDGNLSNDNRHITMLSSDYQLLETFCECLIIPKTSIRKRIKSGFDISTKYKSKDSFRVQFSNVQLHTWLCKIGLFPNKTYKLKIILVPNKYFKDFIRGWFDGDGSVFTYTDTYHTPKNPKYIYHRLYVKLTSASIVHVRWISERINRLINIRGSIQILKANKQRINRVPIAELKYSKKESIIFLNWIYYNNKLPCLLRKFDIAKPFIEKK